MITATVVDGKIQDTSKAEEAARNAIGAKSAKDKAVSGTTFDKEMFLKLLAAEMQYQDPMEPTDNSQYVAEMASFSQVEATTNVADSVSQIQANSLVGNYATVSTDSGDVTGIVDYVTKKDDGEMYVSIEDKEYKASDVKKVQDATYYEAGAAAASLSSMIAKLPSADDVLLSDADSVKAAKNLYDSMSSYTKQFLPAADAQKLTALSNKIAELQKKAAEKTDTEKNTDSAEKTEPADSAKDGTESAPASEAEETAPAAVDPATAEEV